MRARRGTLGWLAAWGALGLVAGCAEGPLPVSARPPTGLACPVGTQQMLVAELFFGRTIGGGARPGRVSESDWDRFAADTLAHTFPDGFTVRNAIGAWRDPASERMITEATKDVVAALADRPEALASVRQAMAVYRQRFHQQSVGLLLRRACGAF